MANFKQRSGPRFAKAYTKLLRDPSISPGAKALYCVLKSYADANSHCHPATATLADNLGVNRKTAVKWLRELEDSRIITRTPRYRQSVQTTSDYLLDDAHFAVHLARKDGGPKSGPQGWPKKRTTEVDPLKKSTVIKFPSQKSA